jgi:predicted phage terminase large subunit-like protein
VAVQDQRADRLADLLSPRLTRYNAAEPLSVKQQVGLLLSHIPDVLFGGSAGGGKSSWLLHAALQYVDVPGYSAILFRRTYKQLAEPGALMDRSKLWLGGTDAEWSETDKKWTFPSGATLSFGHLDTSNDWMKYQGPEYAFLGFDELTQFDQRNVRYLWSRLRKPKPTSQWTQDALHGVPAARRADIDALAAVPLRFRAASNPGGPAHVVVQSRYGLYRPDGDPDPRRLCERPSWVGQHQRIFIPSRVEDNPGLDVEEYVKSLSHLDPTTREQLLRGDWDVVEPGEYFRREWFQLRDVPPPVEVAVRYWDFAATEPSDRNPDPDWTVGLKLGRKVGGGWVILDVQRFRRRSGEVERRVRAVADSDGMGVRVGIEQEPGASGKTVVALYRRQVLAAFSVQGFPPADTKAVRARPVASKCEAGLVDVVRAPWNQEFFDEAERFPPDKDEGHDDQIDALSGAFQMLEGRGAWRAL